MVVRRHTVCRTVHLILRLRSVVEAVDYDIYVLASLSLTQKSRCLSGAETGTFRLRYVGVALVSAPVADIAVDAADEVFAAAHSDDFKFSVKKVLHILPFPDVFYFFRKRTVAHAPEIVYFVIVTFLSTFDSFGSISRMTVS